MLPVSCRHDFVPAKCSVLVVNTRWGFRSVRLARDGLIDDELARMGKTPVVLQKSGVAVHDGAGTHLDIATVYCCELMQLNV